MSNKTWRQGRGLRAEGMAAQLPFAQLPFALLPFALLLVMPTTVAAQGPMIVERVHSGFAATPEVKETEFDHRAFTLVGGNAGWIADETLFLGGGGYWLANGSHDREMAYGGFVFQWLARSNERVGFSAKGLIGGGQARLTDTITQIVYMPGPMPFVNGRPDFEHTPAPTRRTVTTPVRLRDDFFVAEPEADVRVRLSRNTRLTAGIGYRFAVGELRQEDSRLRGAVATVGLQLGGGF